MDYQKDFIGKLRAEINRPLPGQFAQGLMLPEGRLAPFESSDYFKASTLICLYPRPDGYFFPVIQRTEHPEDHHSNQVSLPGGRLLNGELPQVAALRESHEEIDLNPEDVRIIGQLTPLPIPVSRHLVFPFVGYIDYIPELVADISEVERIHLLPIQGLLNPEYRRNAQWNIEGRLRQIPHFRFGELIIWGATAMILSEFAEILRNIYD